MGPSTGLSVLKLCEFKSRMEGSYASVCVSVSACVHFKTAWKSFGSSVPRPLGADGGHVLGLQSRGNQLQVPPPQPSSSRKLAFNFLCDYPAYC